jgi:hypothetical protein
MAGDGRSSKYSDLSKEIALNTSMDTIPVSSSIGPHSIHHSSPSIDEINGHPSITPSNMLFPSGKFFGLFPRMGNNLEDHLQVNFNTIVVLELKSDKTSIMFTEILSK